MDAPAQQQPESSAQKVARILQCDTSEAAQLVQEHGSAVEAIFAAAPQYAKPRSPAGPPVKPPGQQTPATAAEKDVKPADESGAKRCTRLKY